VTAPVVSVAVVVKDRRDLMARCLDGILAQDLDAPYEVVVVDNGSTDGTRELIAEVASAASVPVTLLDDEGSLGAIRNLAVAVAAAPVVAFCDSDCVPSPSWLRRGLAAMDTGVGVVQGRTVPDPSVPLRRWASTQDLAGLTGRYEACNIFYRREALLGTSGFDEAIGFFGEDTAAGLEVRRAGFEARYCEDAVVAHAVTQPGLRWHLRRGLGYANWNRLVRRYPELRTQLWHRWFLRRESAAFAGAAAGVLAAVVARRTPPLVLAVPYLILRRPAGRSRSDLVDAAGAVAFDAAVFAGLARGSIRERTVVL